MTTRPEAASASAGAGRTDRGVRAPGVVRARDAAPTGDPVPTGDAAPMDGPVPAGGAGSAPGVVRAEDVIPGDDAGTGDAAGSGGADDVAERVWRAMGALVLGGDDRRKAVVDALGMSFFRAKALRRIAASPGSQLSRLAARLGTDRPYLTLVVDDLEKRGLVVREQHPRDRRSKTVTATPEGAAAAARAEAILGTPPRAMAALSPQDLATLDRILTTLLRSSESPEAGPSAHEAGPSAHEAGRRTHDADPRPSDACPRTHDAGPPASPETDPAA